MKLKKLLFVACMLFGLGAYSQETFPPDEVIVGTFIGKTIPLRDFALQEENLDQTIKEIRIVQNGSRYHEQVNANALPTGIDQTVQKNFGNKILSALPLQSRFLFRQILQELRVRTITFMRLTLS